MQRIQVLLFLEFLTFLVLSIVLFVFPTSKKVSFVSATVMALVGGIVLLLLVFGNRSVRSLMGWAGVCQVCKN